MKTPEEIMNGLACCIFAELECSDECPYAADAPNCSKKLLIDACVALAGKDTNVPAITGETSDGYHTFNELYHHRAVLFSVIVKAFPDKAWKSKLHDDGSMYDGMFIVGIETPDGQATYHYDIEPYWEMFRCKELERAPKWDGHTADDAIERIGKLEPVRHGRWIRQDDTFTRYMCSECESKNHGGYENYYPNCGAKMDLEVQDG